jgi:hypothetical protein
MVPGCKEIEYKKFIYVEPSAANKIVLCNE